MRIYVAGPIRGMPDYNRPAFEAAAERLREAGHDVANPAEIGDVYGTPEEIEANPRLMADVVGAELEILYICDAIYLLRGWQNSEGTLKELMLAIKKKKIIMIEGE